ncbi:MAG: nicotinate-nucleotide adenylyltransferase [Bacteroidales bacterium]|nr:nicotinate-nucleotide adenylyltransferase [Bacteroidales bacterium]
MIHEKVGLFFGSFNPIHNGHMMLANYMVEFTDLQEVWFIVSPQNPLKDKKSLLADFHRLDLVYKAVDDYPKFKVSDIEFRLPKPSYTIDTLVRLSEKNPDKSFSVICGMDSLQSFQKWKNYDVILRDYHVLVYPRKGYSPGQFENYPSVQLVDAPEIEVSSSFLRHAVSVGKDVRFFIPPKAYQYIVDMHFYE